MKKGFYSKLAISNIRKNYRFFIPHILTGTGLLASFYIVLTLAMDQRLSEIKGGSYIPFTMVIGTVVMGLLSTILIFYTNSFLMKRRKREFGLYNVLGMERRHVGKVLWWESFISNTLSILLGLGFGIVFYKLCSILICKILDTDVVIGFYFIRLSTIIPSVLFFVLLYSITYVYNRIQIRRIKPIEMLQSVNIGEKEPKIKWVLLIAGALSLGMGYYIALMVQNPLEAILFFFAAVFFVILGTYFLFVSGSIFVLKCLKKKETYYYNRKHMTAVSGLLYRMKQNAVGLASIAILSTGVLVMISTTVCLYAGMTDMLNKQYPEEAYFSMSLQTKEGSSKPVSVSSLTKMVTKSAEETGLDIQKIHSIHFLETPFSYDATNKELKSDISDINFDTFYDFIFISRDEYCNLTGQDIHLSSNSIAVCPMQIGAQQYGKIEKTISVYGTTFSIAEELPYFPISSPMSAGMNTYGIVLPNEDAMQMVYDGQKEQYGLNASSYTDKIALKFKDRSKACEQGDVFYQSLSKQMELYYDTQQKANEYDGYMNSFDSVWDSKENSISLYGCLLFLGIILGCVCMFATVLIIYYKQISEGYEDRARYQIMEKIGMSNKEVKKTIRSQMRMVFFLPVVVAGIHVAVAFPILTKLLHVLMLTNVWWFVLCACIVYVAFLIVYTLIFAQTAKTYYSIVH